MSPPKMDMYLRNLGWPQKLAFLNNAELRWGQGRKGKVHLPPTPLNTDHSQIQENRFLCYCATEQGGEVGWVHHGEPMVYKC